MEENNNEVLSRDLLPSMIPTHEMFNEMETENNVTENDENSTLLGGAGTPVTNVGPTYYTAQVAPILLQGINTGR